MRKLIFILSIILTITSFSQTQLDPSGMYKIVLKLSGLKSNPGVTYAMLSSDGTYLWGIDSSKIDPMDGVSKGTWSVTSQNELKFVDNTGYTRYFVPDGIMYRYVYYDKDGVKTRDRATDMSLFIQKY